MVEPPQVPKALPVETEGVLTRKGRARGMALKDASMAEELDSPAQGKPSKMMKLSKEASPTTKKKAVGKKKRGKR